MLSIAQECIPVGFASHARFSPSVRVLLEEISHQHCPSQFLAALSAKDKACAQLGTLGGGNHFLEVWLIIFSANCPGLWP
jgi:tRNA-splicing ligase RtcB